MAHAISVWRATNAEEINFLIAQTTLPLKQPRASRGRRWKRGTSTARSRRNCLCRESRFQDQRTGLEFPIVAMPFALAQETRTTCTHCQGETSISCGDCWTGALQRTGTEAPSALERHRTRCFWQQPTLLARKPCGNRSRRPTPPFGFFATPIHIISIMVIS